MALVDSMSGLSIDDEITASSIVGEGEFEEGEIIGDESDHSNSPKTIIPHQPHVLEHSWTFWFDNPSAKAKGGTWGSSIRPVHTFGTVEEFWRKFTSESAFISSFPKCASCSLYNNIHKPSKLAVGADFHCFKHKIEPKWEDPICANGGKWTISFPKGKSDTSWLYTLLAMIGEQFDNGDEICGAVINIRGKQEKISIWTKNATNETAQVSIGKQWKEFLDYNDSIGFIFHDDAKKQDSRFAKSKYTV